MRSSILLTSLIILLISLLLISLTNCNPSNYRKQSVEPEKKVILILVDGVRYDYIKDPTLKGFQRMAKKGVRAEYVQPIFPSNSYPNWYTIVTGMLNIFSLHIILPYIYSAMKL